MRYVPSVYRPPSEARSYILQATLGCSWNNCTYCAMYRDKPFAVRPLEETIEDVAEAGRRFGDRVKGEPAGRGSGVGLRPPRSSVEKVFVADGDALVLPMEHWAALLAACRRSFPGLRQVSCYATAENLVEKGAANLVELREQGLTLVYIGPESGDEPTMRRIAKGPRPPGAPRESPYLFDRHVEAARVAREAGLPVSAIFLLGAGGVARSAEHALGSASLATAMDPAFLSALTLTVVPGTPLAKLVQRGLFTLPEPLALLGELRTFLAHARPTRSVFRTNHASNYLPLSGHLPRDTPRLLSVLDAALSGEVPLRPEWVRGL